MRFKTKIMICVLLLISFTFGVGGSILISTSFQDSLDREKNADLYAFQMIVKSLESVAVGDGGSQAIDMHMILYQLDTRSASWCAMRLSYSDATLYQSGKVDLFSIPINNVMWEGSDFSISLTNTLSISAKRLSFRLI